MTTLGISLGTRSSGVAVISLGSLVHWRTHGFPGEWSDRKAQAILNRIERCITQHRVKRVLIKVPPFSHQTPALTCLLRQLLERCGQRGCQVKYLTKQAIRRYVPEVENTATLMQYVVNRYPILASEQRKELLGRQPYYLKMFEAVLVAHVFLHRGEHPNDWA